MWNNELFASKHFVLNATFVTSEQNIHISIPEGITIGILFAGYVLLIIHLSVYTTFLKD